ncbi:MAG: 4-alpha-glucanotransferase [Acidobacteriota bacterium]|jgi:4-alpha-glucanotransferase|nr:4-alpha-glucanotransferase [Acidobacteriota bacterium]
MARKSGILLHPTSLPGDSGIGDFGRWAYRFADFLAESGQQLWQILPLGPTGFGNSPYQTWSSFAGNPLLISLDKLAGEGWLAAEDLPQPAAASFVDFDAAAHTKWPLLKKAARAFFSARPAGLFQEFEDFCLKNDLWLDSFARFAALREANNNAPWTKWEPAKTAEERTIAEHKFIQFEFHRQWLALKQYCNGLGIEIIGDIPIFVAHDSADVWANRLLFDLDEKGNPENIAGVPPDYFSKTGQLWGNPLYRWNEMARDGFTWWINRIRAAMRLTDIIRLDHFRGFEKFYQIPAGSETAVNGTWVNGPGDKLFQALKNAFGKLPFIAEDLGYITPEVRSLRDRWKFPGMRILQFAFTDELVDNPHKPYNFIKNCVVYTGTHDNDTTAGWFADKTTRKAGEMALAYTGSGGAEPVWDFIRLALGSVADTVILPMQDVLGLASDARMNTPSTKGDNWQWRMTENDLRPDLALKLRGMIQCYGRQRQEPAQVNAD